MISRSFAFLLIALFLAVAVDAQIPVPQGRSESRTLPMFFDGNAGYLGVMTEEVTKQNFAKFGLSEVRGVSVEKVVAGSPAEKAGILEGDVILRLNGEEVTSVRKMSRLLGEISPDHQVKVTVFRGGSEREIVATAGKRPTPKFEEGGFSTIPGVPFPRTGEFPPMPRMEGVPRVEGFPPGAPDRMNVWRIASGRRIGVSVTPLTKQLAEHFSVAGGVMINEVRVDSPAAKAGLKAGDIVVEADGKEIKAESDLVRAIGEKKEGDVTLTIVRDRNRQTVSVTPEEVKGGFEAPRFEFRQTPDGSFAPGDFNFSLPTMMSVPTGGFSFPRSIWCLL